MKLTHNMRQALIDLDNPLCSASVYWSTSTMKALHARGLVDKRDNGITWSWELRPEGKAYLAASGTSGCAMCDDLKSENAALREKVDRLKRDYECSEKSLQRHEHMVAELMEKVEAWEWFEECFEVMQWLVPMGPNRADGCTEAVMSTLHAQKGAVHADRE